MEDFDLRKYLAENRLLKEFIGGELEDRNEPLYDKLVPGQGAAETLEGGAAFKAVSVGFTN